MLAVERKKEKKEKGKKEKREKQRGFPKDRFVHFCTIPLHFFLEKSLVESNGRLSIKDLGLDLKIWQEHIHV